MSKHLHIATPDTDNWDIEIKPKASLFEINLKELWQYRDLLVLFVKRDFSAQYKQTVLGPLWHVIQPVFTTIMFLFVFGKIANIPTDGIEPKLLFYMSGITIWNYFAACLTSTSSTFVSNASIFGKVYFPRLIIPLSVVFSNIVRFGIQMLLLIVAMIFFAFKGYNFSVGISCLLIPVCVIMMAGIGLGLGIIISSLTTKYRDFTVLIGFGVQLLMYATPIAYPLSFAREKGFARFIEANPLTGITEAFRYAVFNSGAFNPGLLLYSGIFMLLVLVIGTIIFNKVEKSFMDTV
jgi:lipopolysaccharide transport system permease protein